MLIHSRATSPCAQAFHLTAQGYCHGTDIRKTQCMVGYIVDMHLYILDPGLKRNELGNIENYKNAPNPEQRMQATE